MKVGHECEKSLQAPAKKGSLEDGATCNLLGKHSVLDKKKVKFSVSTHRSEGLLDSVHVSFWEPAKTASLGGHSVTPRSCGYGDVMTTYIRRAKILSHIYTKP